MTRNSSPLENMGSKYTSLNYERLAFKLLVPPRRVGSESPKTRTAMGGLTRLRDDLIFSRASTLTTVMLH